MSMQDPVDRLRVFAARAGLSKGQLAARAGLRDTVLRNFDSPNWNPTLKTLLRLDGIVPNDFFDLPAPSPPAAEPSIQSQPGA